MVKNKNVCIEEHGDESLDWGPAGSWLSPADTHLQVIVTLTAGLQEGCR